MSLSALKKKNTMNPSVDAASSHKVSLWRVAIISGHPQWVPLVFLQGTTEEREKEREENRRQTQRRALARDSTHGPHNVINAPSGIEM
jgi:hypothetical protein